MANLYISPTGAGTKDGSSAANAGSIANLSQFISKAGPGGTVNLIADKGAYTVTKQIDIAAGGVDGSPVTITGISSAGQPMKATFIGNRTDPYDVNGTDGTSVFRLNAGANNLKFQNMAFEDVGDGAFQVNVPVKNLTLEHMSADNVQRFFENYGSSATISGLTIRDVEVHGFSKSFMRLQADTHNVLVENVFADSERQDGDSFAMGVHLDHTVHDVTLRKVTMLNSQDTRSSSEYWNGDGFASEENTYNIHFEDTVAKGATDAGYDLKSSNVTMLRALSEDNKRNYRFWGDHVELTDSTGLNPHKRGGIGSQAQVWAGEDSTVTIKGGTFSDSDPDTIVFHLQGAAMNVSTTTVTKAAAAQMSSVVSGSTLNYTPYSGGGSATVPTSPEPAPDSGTKPNDP